MNPHWEKAALHSWRLAAQACWDEPPERWQPGVDHCLAQIEPILPAAGRVLDLGCGVGRLLLPLARKYPTLDFYGFDASEAMLRHVLPERRPNVWLVAGDGKTLHKDVPHLEAAYSVLTFQHCDAETVAGYVEQIGQRLVPSGVFCFQFVAVGDSGPLSHIHQVEAVLSWCRSQLWDAVAVTTDAVYPTWRWVTATRTP